MLYGTGRSRVGPVTLSLAGMAPVKGDLAPRTLSGRLPPADDEIALPLAVLTVVHVIVTSVHHRRRDLALRRSLGADRRRVTRAVHWQATSFSLVPVALGVPLGLIAGRLVFGLFADSLGAVPSASIPYVLLTAAASPSWRSPTRAPPPARRARRLAPAPLLANE